VTISTSAQTRSTDGKYAYNNLNGYYLTWYHKIDASSHTATEGWYQYERDVPNIAGNVANPITLETGANGAYCSSGQLRCYAPDWAIVNYLEKDFNHHHDSLNIRNEYVDDIRGQRTGYKTRYTEHLVASITGLDRRLRFVRSSGWSTHTTHRRSMWGTRRLSSPSPPTSSITSETMALRRHPALRAIPHPEPIYAAL
jgi:hypothetical protein